MCKIIVQARVRFFHAKKFFAFHSKVTTAKKLNRRTFVITLRLHYLPLSDAQTDELYINENFTTYNYLMLKKLKEEKLTIGD